MADYLTLPGTGRAIAGDDIGGDFYQRVKVAHGADGSATDVSASNPLPIGGAMADDATAAGNPVAIGAVYQATPDLVDDGDAGWVRMTARRALVGAADYRTIYIDESTPMPSGSDLRGLRQDLVGAFVWGNVLGNDLEIRNTNRHCINIPLAESGWRKLTIAVISSLDQSVQLTIMGVVGSADAMLDQLNDGISRAWGILAQFNMATSSTGCEIGGEGAGNDDSYIINKDNYPADGHGHCTIPALESGLASVVLQLIANDIPTSGSLNLWITRST